MNRDLISALTAQRHQLKMTQSELSDKTGINRMTISKIESNQTDPRLSSLYEIARAMGLELMAVPTDIRPQLESFVKSKGRIVGQPEGIDAPVSIVSHIIK